VPPREPGPRQRERSAATRETVVGATIDIIRDGGLDAATAASIADRSGISWGGIQHQFGNKAAVLDACAKAIVVELGHEFVGLGRAGTSIEDRVEALVDAIWLAVRHPDYQPLLAILRDRAAAAGAAPDEMVLDARATAGGTARHLFADLDLDTATTDLVDSFAFGALGGLADQSRLAPVNDEFAGQSLDLVRKAVVSVVTDAASPHTGVDEQPGMG
jgi:AcrR family transcriptional regulator